MATRPPPLTSASSRKSRTAPQPPPLPPLLPLWCYNATRRTSASSTAPTQSSGCLPPPAAAAAPPRLTAAAPPLNTTITITTSSSSSSLGQFCRRHRRLEPPLPQWRRHPTPPPAATPVLSEPPNNLNPQKTTAAGVRLVIASASASASSAAPYDDDDDDAFSHQHQHQQQQQQQLAVASPPPPSLSSSLCARKENCSDASGESQPAGAGGGAAAAESPEPQCSGPWQRKRQGWLRWDMGAVSTSSSSSSSSSSPHDREIAAVALPALVGLTLEPAVNAVNAGLVGHLGTQQLSAVSLGGIAMHVCSSLFNFLLLLTVPEIASAVASRNDGEVSRVAARKLWVAAGCGLLAATAVGLGAPSVVAALHPREPAVAAHATQYIMIRALAIPAVLLGFVSTGVFRGFKDTRTPLLGTGTSVAVSFCLHVLLLNVLHLDVLGAAAAAALASYSSCAVMLGAMITRGKLRLRHLATPPPVSAVLPILQRGVVLAARSLVTFGMALFASTLCVRKGAALQASFEVIRQTVMLSIPFFECLNVATQSLCASALGHQDRVTARSLLNRLLFLGTGVGALVGVAVWAAREPLIGFFTTDPEVVDKALTALPLVCLCFPIDAAGYILDGALLASKQSNYMSAVQIAGSVVQYGILMGIVHAGRVDTLPIWAAIRVMALVRVVGGALGLFVSRKSAYTTVRCCCT